VDLNYLAPENTIAGSCEQGNAYMAFIKLGEFLAKFSRRTLLHRFGCLCRLHFRFQSSEV